MSISDEDFNRKVLLGIDYIKLCISLLKWGQIAQQKGLEVTSEYSSDEISTTFEAILNEEEYLRELVHKEFPETKGEE